MIYVQTTSKPDDRYFESYTREIYNIIIIYKKVEAAKAKDKQAWKGAYKYKKKDQTAGSNVIDTEITIQYALI